MIGGSSPQNLISGPTAWSSTDLELDFSASLDNSGNQLDARAGLTNSYGIFNLAIRHSVYLFHIEAYTYATCVFPIIDGQA
jgi:hypothetical protein